ncbi:MAG: NPCBM/NEW2 domain-containing protein [Planctomycetes bacterium]|nr:NPCBM/NEW2 domain-containing protein [Planctomycetota bacterium]
MSNFGCSCSMLKIVLSIEHIRRLLFAVAAALLICGIGSAAETGRSVSWHLEDAAFRFRIEKDPAYSQIPDVHLSDLKKKRNWTGAYYRLNGKVYKKGVTMSCPGEASYKHEKQHRRFVALAGLNDRADSDMSVSFEVYANKRRLYRSEPLTKHMPPVEINVGVPSTAKEIKIVTTGSDMKGRRWAILVNAGFLLRGKNPEVSFARLYTPGYDARDFEAVVFTTIGQRVPSRLFWTQQDEPMEILFDNSYGSTIYFVYLVHKNKYKAVPSSWEPKAGVTLETRYTTKNYPECKEMSGLLKVWDDVAEPVGKSLVDNVHHSFPIHHLSDLKGKKPRLALYRYEGFFRTEEAGQYIFATASNWSSHLLVDGNLVISWPGEHNYRAGIKGEKQGKISLGAGVHKLEYLNYSPWGQMFTLAAWQRPQEKLSLMTRGDFLPVGRFVATAIGYKDLTKDGGSPRQGQAVASFKWQITDDWRLDQEKAALVRMRFDVLKAKRAGNYSYRWKFDDGKIETGESIEHVFLRPQMRTVTLEVLKDGGVIAEVRQKIHVHILWDKIQLEPGNKQAFEKAISESDLSKVPIGDIVNLYAFADGLKRQQWKQQAVVALMKRMDELVAEPRHQQFCLELGRYLRSAPVRQYEQALKLFTRLQEKSAPSPAVRRHAMVSQAELLVQCFGKAQEALKILNQVEKEKKLDNKIPSSAGFEQTRRWRARFRMAKAEALIALEQVEEAREILQNLQTNSNSTKQDVKYVGLLRHARLLAENTDDPVQLDYAMEKIEAIIANDPVKLLMPNLNLIKLDVHLARKEYLVAFYLAERLNKLELSNYYRSQILVRQVKALCGIKDVEQAKVIYETMTTDYPYSPAVAEAKKVIIETVVAGQNKKVPKVN